MKFLDLTGLTYFFSKVKTWAGNNYLSLKGGTINGDVNISGNVSALQFKKTNGTSTQVLIADGSVKGINSANGIAGLDSNGYVPLSQLGNLDTTVAEVVTALPTTNIKKHIYLIEDEDGDTQNQYKEYIYTGDTSATYDASKWEKLGDFRATVDLADYAKKSEAIGNFSPELSEEHVALRLYSVDEDNHKADVIIDKATNEFAGVMTSSDKIKLDGIDKTYAKKSDTVKSIAFSSYGSTPVKILKVTKADGTEETISIPNASSGDDGFMGSNDKRKLDGIASGATADSAITTAEIDALFA